MSESAIDEWREKVLAYDREATALRSGHGPGHDHEDGHVDDDHEHEHEAGEGDVHGGHGGFSYDNRPYDPFRANDPVVNSLFALLKPDATVLDVLAAAREDSRCRWPREPNTSRSWSHLRMPWKCCGNAPLRPDCPTSRSINHPWEDAEAPTADFILCSLVLHHVPEAAQFIAKMQERATERVVVVEMMEPPSALEMPFYERVYGSAPTQMPGLPEVLQLLWAIDINPDVTMLPIRKRLPSAASVTK